MLNRMLFSQIVTTPEQQRVIESIEHGFGWSVQPASILSYFRPRTFISKIDSVIASFAPTSSGGTSVLLNSLRIDTNAVMVDQDPIAFFQNSTGITQVGVHLHHGSWNQRSWAISSDLRRHLSEHGVGGYFLDHPPNNLRSGSLDNLPPGSEGAISAAGAALRSLNRFG
jgi:hypothetical protein